MKTKILKSSEYQNRIFEHIKRQISEIKETCNKVPGMTFIACSGHWPGMKYIIDLYEKVAKDLGFNTYTEILTPTEYERDLLEITEKHNNNPNIHAVVELKPCSRTLMPVLIADLFRNTTSVFKRTIINEIKRKRKNLSPFSLLKNYNLIRSEFALLQGN